MSGRIYFIPTPIGNLEDITLRAIRLLKEVDLVLAEDTRTSSKLLNHFDIQTPMRAYHMHNEHRLTYDVVEMVKDGKSIALISDAGTPGISDPGFLLVRAGIEAQLRLEILPGPVAFVPALINSGLPTHRFTFEGFLPPKKGRSSRIKALVDEERTMIFYESPYKLIKTLNELLLHFGDRKASVSRELTKVFEETLRSNLSGLIDHFEKAPPKGEFVLVVEGSAG